MEVFYEITSMQKRILAAFKEFTDIKIASNVRQLADKHDAPRTTPRYCLKVSTTPNTILSHTERGGSKQRLFPVEEIQIFDTLF